MRGYNDNLLNGAPLARIFLGESVHERVGAPSRLTWIIRFPKQAGPFWRSPLPTSAGGPSPRVPALWIRNIPT